MTILLWIIGITLVIVGLVGTVLPALPGAMLIVAGLVVAAWADGFTTVGVWTLVVIGLEIMVLYALTARWGAVERFD